MDPKNAFLKSLNATEKTIEYLRGAARAGDAMAIKGAAEALVRRVAGLKLDEPVTAGKVYWAKDGDKWVVGVKYANGKFGGRNAWEISEHGGKFALSVKNDNGHYKCKKSFDTLEQAQRYGNKFVDRADGGEMLEKEVSDGKFAKG